MKNFSGWARTCGIFFLNEDSVEGQLRFAPELTARVNTYLSSITDKLKSPPIPETTVVRTGLVNTTFWESDINYAEGPDAQPLSREPVYVYSNSPFAFETVNHALLDVHHRRRTERARGLCYTRPNGLALPGASTNNVRDNTEHRIPDKALELVSKPGLNDPFNLIQSKERMQQ